MLLLHLSCESARLRAGLRRGTLWPMVPRGNGGAVLDICCPRFRASGVTVSASLLWYANEIDYSRHDSRMDLAYISNVRPLALDFVSMLGSPSS